MRFSKMWVVVPTTCIALTGIAVAVPASANVLEAHATTAKTSTLRAKYRHRYKMVVHRLGSRAAGRNILRDGVHGRKGDRPATNHELAVSARQLRMLLMPMLNPAPPHLRPAMVASARATGGLPSCIRQHESGGNYGAVDPSGTYRGAYQFDYATFAAAGGSGDPAAASPAEQDAAFARWWPAHHSAWPVSGPACGG